MRIQKDSLQEIIAHARECYPKKCRGLLIGRREPELTVKRLYRVNGNHAGSGNGQGIDPMELHQVNKTTWGKKEEILGFYHSHPDSPATPSDHDSQHAWPSYCYLIVNVKASGEAEPRAWHRRAASGQWEEEIVEVE